LDDKTNFEQKYLAWEKVNYVKATWLCSVIKYRKLRYLQLFSYLWSDAMLKDTRQFPATVTSFWHISSFIIQSLLVTSPCPCFPSLWHRRIIQPCYINKLYCNDYAINIELIKKCYEMLSIKEQNKVKW